MKTTNLKEQSAARRAANRAKASKSKCPRVRARPIHEGRSYKLTRRCIERRMFFAPDAKAAEIDNFIGYVLAHVANKYGIQVHACVFMSNHHHTDVTDPHGRIVDFKRSFHSLLARGINALRGRFDGVWSREKPGDTRRPSLNNSLEHLAYTLTNPVKDGLVKWGEQWPGFTTYGWRFGVTRRFKRPKWFFDPDGDMPEFAELTLQRPIVRTELSDDELFDVLMDVVRSSEKRHQQRIHDESRRFVGREKLLRQKWDRKPHSPAERYAERPSVAASDEGQLVAELALEQEWRRVYAEAREKLLAGRDVVFPAGTYWLWKFAGVAVEGRAPP